MELVWIPRPSFVEDFFLGNKTFLITTTLSILAGLALLRHRKARNLPPGLPAVPVLGSIPFLNLTGRDDYLYLTQLYRKYGTIYSFWLGKNFTIVLNGYDVIREALIGRARCFAGRPMGKMRSMHAVNPNIKGIVDPDYTTEWVKERTVTLSILRDFGFGKHLMESRIQAEADNLVSHIASLEGTPFNPREPFTIAVGNVISSITLGTRFPFGGCEELLRVLQAIDTGLATVTEMMPSELVPIIQLLPKFRRLQKIYVDEYEYTFSFLRQFITDHKKNYVPGKEDDFIDAFIGKMGLDFRDDDLLYIIRDFFVAGTETSSTALLWTSLYLANNPHIQKRMQAEIDQVVGRGRPVSLQDKCRLPYTEAVTQEVQRIASIVPMAIWHMTMSDTKLFDYDIPEGTTVFVNLWSVLRDPKLWPEPDQFRPERFLDEQGKALHRSELIPFSLGKRMCLGEMVARQELLLFVCSLVQNFDICLPPGVGRLDENGVANITRVPCPFKVIMRKRE